MNPPAFPAILVFALLIGAGAALIAPRAQASEFNDPLQTFSSSRFVISAEAGGGQADTRRLYGNLQLFNLGARFSLLPFGLSGRGHFYFGAFELGFEPFFQRYRFYHQNLGGGAVVGRYHLLGLRFGRMVPYLEGFGGVGGTDLKLLTLTANVNFIIQAGVGLEYFISERFAPYLGFRLQHISDAGLQGHDDAFQSYLAVVGLSFFTP